MIAGALLAIPLLFGAPASPNPPEPLDADVVDTSTFPDVVIDLVPPSRYAAVDIRADMVEIGGAPVNSVTRVDPAGVVVSVVIDDGPTVPVDVVTGAQGASVELVRNVGDGTEIALATPSGMQSALTPDRDANIARIAGITAGAPDVVPLPALVLDVVTRLAASPALDRHLVIVQSTPIPAGPTLDQITAVADAAGITVHLVAAPGVDVGAIADLAADSGGVVPVGPEMVAEMDRVTAAIVDRFRVAATVDAPGPTEVALTVQGDRLITEVNLTPPPAPTTTSAVTPAPTVAPQVAATPTPTPTPTTAAVAAAAPPASVAPPTSVAPPGGFGRVTRMLVAVAVAAFVIGVLALLYLVRRRPASVLPAPAAVAGGPGPLDPPVEPTGSALPEPISTEPAEVFAELTSAPRPLPVVEPAPEPEPVPTIEAASEPEPELVVEPVVEPVADVGRDRVVAPVRAPVRASRSSARPGRGTRPPRSAPDRTGSGRQKTRAEASGRSTPLRRRGSSAQPITRAAQRSATAPTGASTQGWLVVGDLRMCSATGEVWAGERQVVLTPAELGVLELLMTSGGQGVTTEAIIKATQLDETSEEWDAPDAIVARLRRKTGVRGQGRSVRKARVILYFFGNEDDETDDG